MEVTITGLHVDLSAEAKAIIETKLGKLAHYASINDRLTVTVAFEQTYQIKGHLMSCHATSEADDLQTAIDRLVEKLNHQLSRKKSKT